METGKRLLWEGEEGEEWERVGFPCPPTVGLQPHFFTVLSAIPKLFLASVVV